MNSFKGSSSSIIECRGVVKRYYYYLHRTNSLREWFIRNIKRQPINVRGPEFVLNQFDLSVERGETVALIGPNGAGKSTILRLIAGVYKPTEGTIEVKGRVGAIMELGVGFHHELTGVENIKLCGAFMGFSPKQIKARNEEIVEFADIGDFINTPVKYYSSGMQARLAFAVSLNVQLDTILIDEVLAVGDKSFQSRCIKRLISFQKNGGTILMASHDLNMVQNLCRRAVWIEHGTARMVGKSAEVVEAYQEAVAKNSRN